MIWYVHANLYLLFLVLLSLCILFGSSSSEKIACTFVMLHKLDIINYHEFRFSPSIWAVLLYNTIRFQWHTSFNLLHSLQAWPAQSLKRQITTNIVFLKRSLIILVHWIVSGLFVIFWFSFSVLVVLLLTNFPVFWFPCQLKFVFHSDSNFRWSSSLRYAGSVWRSTITVMQLATLDFWSEVLQGGFLSECPAVMLKLEG